MDVFLLGAGRPAHGQKPSALKHIALNTKAMDWQIHSFKSVANLDNIHFLGGYHVDAVIEDYPQLKFSVIPDWQNRSVLYTLLKAPFSDRSTVVTYSDTIFRNKVVEEIISVDADVVFGIDTKWKERFEKRPADDINSAETIEIKDSLGKSHLVEFTGLVSFGEKAVQCLKGLDEHRVGSTLIHLLEFLKSLGLSVCHFDVAGDWAEFNFPKDIANFILGTKADTLARLEPLVRKCHIGRQVSFTFKQWKQSQNAVLEDVIEAFSNERLVVRSSSRGEDNWHSSNAGGFKSLLNVKSSDRNDVFNAIKAVISSYGDDHGSDDQILIQRCLQNVQMAGVVFTCGLETGSPYYRFNFDDKSKSTESVTSGAHGDLRTIIVSRLETGKLETVEPALVPVLDAVIELEKLLGFDKLDIEFAVDDEDIVHVFQVRPITVDHSNYEVDLESIELSLNESIKRYMSSQSHQPFSYGTKTLFSNMSDWNPAEIIGGRPKPLAFSLYRQLITNDVWAQQRFEYGYRDVRSCPLILSFSGQPFVDVRASLNSFIPATLPEETAKRVAEAYIKILADNSQYHDKIEFDVAYTIWTPDFSKSAKRRLVPYGVTDDDILLLEESLKKVTCNALTRLHGDIQSVDQLGRRREMIISSELPAIDKAIALLDDCQRFGTLAFSHAARAGFVATTWLKSFVTVGAMTDERRLAFLKSFSTVTGEFKKDKNAHAKGTLSGETLVAKYGHLRPGTYEVTAQAYWEDPQRYLISKPKISTDTKLQFKFLSSEVTHIDQILDELGSSLTSYEMAQYLIEAIQSRESVKFEFTKNLSIALDLFVESCLEMGLMREDVSFLEYIDLEELKLNAISLAELKGRVELRKQQYAITRLIELPPLIRQKEDFYCFERFASQPNFVTVNKVDALVQQLDSEPKNDIAGKLILTPQADPGYDWLFGHRIAGLITKYGGANSHMAIRAAEINLPAAIGVGEKLYEEIINMKRVELDCTNHTIREIQ
ncbi:MAG: PEP-utilizing enzyme [Chloroflexota bacterium]|nr:PEP-utilizing enzyme [Chloroflexota bacterium]